MADDTSHRITADVYIDDDGPFTCSLPSVPKEGEHVTFELKQDGGNPLRMVQVLSVTRDADDGPFKIRATGLSTTPSWGR